MIIVLTEKKTGLPFTVEAGLVLCSRTVIKEPERNNKREDRKIVATEQQEEPESVTHVITGIQAQGQLQSFAVVESPIEIGRRINAALGCTIDPQALGYPAAFTFTGGASN